MSRLQLVKCVNSKMWKLFLKKKDRFYWFFCERIADNLNSLGVFKVDARAVRQRYGVIKTYFEAREKEEKRASGINPEVTFLDTSLQELIERERECAKNFEVENKKAKLDQELARSIWKEAVETFAETRAIKLDENEEDTWSSARKKSRSYCSETHAYLKEKFLLVTLLGKNRL